MSDSGSSCRTERPGDMPSPVTCQDTAGQWVFITPIANLVLTDAVKKEFKIGQVLFFDLGKLRRIRKQLHIGRRISELHSFLKEPIEKAPTVAVVRLSGKPRELKQTCFDMVRDALHILTLSQLRYRLRDHMRTPAIYGSTRSDAVHHVFLNSQSPIASTEGSLVGNPISLTLDKQWKEWQRKFFFLKLVEILNENVTVCRSWRNNLWRASILMGRSLASGDVPFAFLMNMIVLEMLLTQQGDKYRTIMPQRVEAFLGWAGWWDECQFPDRIREAYTLRCKLVHDGDSDGIEKKHVLFTDNLLMSLLVNMTTHSTLFSSKQAVFKFAEKVAAEHLLGLKSKVRPKKLIMFKPD